MQDENEERRRGEKEGKEHRDRVSQSLCRFKHVMDFAGFERERQDQIFRLGDIFRQSLHEGALSIGSSWLKRVCFTKFLRLLLEEFSASQSKRVHH